MLWPKIISSHAYFCVISRFIQNHQIIYHFRFLFFCRGRGCGAVGGGGSTLEINATTRFIYQLLWNFQIHHMMLISRWTLPRLVFKYLFPFLLLIHALQGHLCNVGVKNWSWKFHFDTCELKEVLNPVVRLLRHRQSSKSYLCWNSPDLKKKQKNLPTVFSWQSEIYFKHGCERGSVRINCKVVLSSLLKVLSKHCDPCGNC